MHGRWKDLARSDFCQTHVLLRLDNFVTTNVVEIESIRACHYWRFGLIFVKWSSAKDWTKIHNDVGPAYHQCSHCRNRLEWVLTFNSCNSSTLSDSTDCQSKRKKKQSQYKNASFSSNANVLNVPVANWWKNEQGYLSGSQTSRIPLVTVDDGTTRNKPKETKMKLI